MKDVGGESVVLLFHCSKAGDFREKGSLDASPDSAHLGFATNIMKWVLPHISCNPRAGLASRP